MLIKVIIMMMMIMEIILAIIYHEDWQFRLSYVRELREALGLWLSEPGIKHCYGVGAQQTDLLLSGLFSPGLWRKERLAKEMSAATRVTVILEYTIHRNTHAEKSEAVEERSETVRQGTRLGNNHEKQQQRELHNNNGPVPLEMGILK